ncbi:MAG: VacJ family lipoprotein [Nitrospira sp. NTP1]|nr:VacJ family lipoprotein [Nitrospira sp. NTP1]
MALVSAVSVLVMVGCAGGSSQTTRQTGLEVESVARGGLRADGVSAVQVAASPAVSSNMVVLAANKAAAPAAEQEPADQPEEDPFYDPFAKGDEPAGGEEYDPWEPVNTKIFEFNRQVDRWVLKPAARGYNAVVPNPVQIGISNVFYNMRFPSRFINNLAQGKLSGAGTEVGRFLLNSSFGLGGLVDVAKYMDITTPEEDTGQTLGYYGVKPGPYVVLPFDVGLLRSEAGTLRRVAVSPPVYVA